MNLGLLLPLLVTTFVAVLSWVISHHLSVGRDMANKRRELRVQYLIDAYRKLEVGTNCELQEEKSRGVESAVADIQLFGTASQVEKAQKFAATFAAEGGTLLDELLADLRNDLRRELRLEKVQFALKHLRITNNERPDNTSHPMLPAASSSANLDALHGRSRE